MPYRIKTDEAPDAALRRMGEEQVTRALEDLRVADPHEAVHQGRKRCKKIRALLRLFRPAMEDTYQSENRWYRDAARKLSELRDATSFLESARALEKRFRGELDHDLFPPLLEALEERRTELAQEKDLGRRLKTVTEMLEEGREKIPGWTPDRSGYEVVAGGLKKTYKRARKALGRAYAQGSDEAFHEWRKRAKYHRYHVRILRGSWSPVLNPWRHQLHELTNLLGDDHDLAVLDRTLEKSPGLAGVPNRTAISGLLVRRRAELQAQARPLGERLFAEFPGTLVDRFGAYWNAGRSEAVLHSTLKEVAVGALS